LCATYIAAGTQTVNQHEEEYHSNPPQVTENASQCPLESSSQERYHCISSDSSFKKLFSQEVAVQPVSLQLLEKALNPELSLLISDLCSATIILDGLSDSIRSCWLQADTIASATASIVSEATKSGLRWSKAASSAEQSNRQCQTGLQTISSDLAQMAFDLQRLQISSVATLQQYIDLQSEYQHANKDKNFWQSKALSLEEEIKILRESCSIRERESRDKLVTERAMQEANKVESARLLEDISVLTKENNDLQRQLHNLQASSKSDSFNTFAQDYNQMQPKEPVVEHQSNFDMAASKLSHGCKSFSSSHRRETLEEVARRADTWQCAEGEVRELLRFLGMEHYALILEREEIASVHDLAQLSEEQLEQVGVKSHGARVLLLDAARGLRTLVDRIREISRATKIIPNHAYYYGRAGS